MPIIVKKSRQRNVNKPRGTNKQKEKKNNTRTTINIQPPMKLTDSESYENWNKKRNEM